MSFSNNLNVYTAKEYAEILLKYSKIIESNKMNTNRSVKQMNTLDKVTSNVRAGNFVVGSFDGATFSVSNTPVPHTTSHDARAECARLARLYPGKLFVFLQLKGAELIPSTPRMSI